MAHNRYQCPSFGGRTGRRRSSVATHDINHYDTENHSGLFQNRSNLSVVDSRISEPSQRNMANDSYISNNNVSSIRSNSVRGRIHGERGAHIKPYHDPTGKPLRRHGTETIGDLLLHPLKELQLHQKRVDAYEAEKNQWNEKHPESIASEHDIVNPEEPIM